MARARLDARMGLEPNGHPARGYMLAEPGFTRRYRGAEERANAVLAELLAATARTLHGVTVPPH
jgi:hypothetical protein